MVAPPAGVEAWVIAVAVVAALILAALVTVAIVLVVGHRKRNSGMNYTPLEEPRYIPMVSNPEPFLAPPPVAPPPVATGSVGTSARRRRRRWPALTRS